MNDILLLTKIELMNLFGINRFINSKSNKKKYHIIVVIIMTFLFISIFSVYGYFIVDQFKKNLHPSYSIMLINLFVSIIIFINTMLISNSIFFSDKNFDIIISLPIKISTVIISKFNYLYIINLFISICIMVPIGIIYGVKMSMVISYYIYYFSLLLFLPIVPILIAIFINFIISIISNKIKHKSIIKIFISLILLYVLFLNIKSVSNLDKINMNGMLIEFYNKIQFKLPLIIIYTKAVCNLKIYDLILYIVVSSVIFIVFTISLAYLYRLLYTKMNTYSKNNKYALKKYKKTSQIKVIYIKSLIEYFSSTTYVLNTAMGIIIMTVSFIALLFIPYSSINYMLMLSGNKNLILKSLPMIIALLTSMTCTTYCAISHEGKTIWILKCMPIKLNIVLLSKVLVNLTLTIPSILLNSTIVMIIFRKDIPLVEGLSLTVIPVLYSICIASTALLLDIKNCNFNWRNEVTVVKQSISLPITMGISIIFVAIPTLMLIFKKNLNLNIFYTVLSIILILYFILICRYIYNNSKKLLFKL